MGGKRIWLVALCAAVAIFLLLLTVQYLRSCAAPSGCPSAVAASHPAARPAAASTGATAVTQNEMHSWDVAKDGDHKAYRAGGLVVSFGRGKDSDGNVAPEITVRSQDGKVARVVGQAWSKDDVRADFGVGRIDPGNETSEVVFSTYSGGAHCCVGTEILELTKSDWIVLDLGTRDGDTLPFPKDENATSTPAFVFRDDRFLYAFASHADSYSPPQVFVIRNARIVDMSASGEYRSVYEKDLRETEAACRNHQNGACAAFAADAARLGRFEDAWRVMLENYDKKDSWELPAGCDAETKDGECPKGHEHKFDNYPDALRAFLARNGYIAGAR